MTSTIAVAVSENSSRGCNARSSSNLKGEANKSLNSSLAHVKPSKGFSVRDILELPSTKSNARSHSNRSSSMTPLRQDVVPSSSLPLSMDSSLSEGCVPSAAYHPSAIYYCDSSYPRWLSHSAADMFAYANPLCKYTPPPHPFCHVHAHV